MLVYLLPNNPRPGRFYLLSKIHKGITPPPGHPIISAIGTPIEKNSHFLDLFLQTLLTSIPSFIKHIGHFLYTHQNLGPLADGSLLVTYDVTSLYTNIPLVDAEEQWLGCYFKHDHMQLRLATNRCLDYYVMSSKKHI